MISRKMTSRRSVLLASAMGGALLFTGSALAVAADIGGGSAPVASKADRAVKALADEAWDNAIQTDFQVRSMLDMPLGDVLFLTEKQHLDKCRWAAGVVSKLKRLDQTQLSDDWLNSYEWLLNICDAEAGMEPFYWNLLSIAPYNIYRHFMALHRNATDIDVRTDKGTQAYLQALDGYVRFIQAHSQRLKDQEKRGILLPRSVIPQVVTMVQTNETELVSNVGAGEQRMAMVAAGSKAGFKAAVDTRLGQIRTSMAELVDFISTPAYGAKAPVAIGAASNPNGQAFYAAKARTWLTTNLTPDEIHRQGAENIVIVTAKIQALATAAGFATPKAFMTSRRNDPRYKPASVQQMVEIDKQMLAALTPKLPQYFSVLPTAAFKTEPLPDALRSTAGMYVKPTLTNRVGVFYFPNYDLSKVTLFGRATLVYHELAHHIQGNVAIENERLHPIHRFLNNTGYNEGWAEYFRSLCDETGLYTDDDRLSVLANSLFKSVQMVVDTGIGYHNWSLEKATAFMKEHLSLADNEIDIEVLRYATRPGYSPAYRLGDLRFQELRAKAASELGQKFDLREFNDLVIGFGGMPLDVLSGRVERYISKRKTA